MNADAEILAALRAAGAEGVSGAELAQRLRVTRAAIWARIHDLRQLGYDIAATPYAGYHLVSAPDLLHADDLAARLGPVRVIGRDLRVFRETASTSDIAEHLARDGVAEGAVVFAEAQARGRGRLGRLWHSPAGKGLWFSVVLRPDLRPAETTRITIAAATALARAIRLRTGLAAAIKWPNDLLFGGRKAAGILTELSAELDRIKYVIVGVGVDVNITAAEFPPEFRRQATSLAIETGHKHDRSDLAIAILRALDHDYERVTRGRFDEVADEWAAQCTTLGQPVSITVGKRNIRGRAEALDADGALLVRTEHGLLERVTGGDVRLER
jgi:BirA family biotin operon repressor/biotin-[acetyl-CoA-carboxylase] ligase